MDNGTLVESFKFLNYCQLAKNSLASKRFRDVIRMHRHRLALLHVKNIHMINRGFNNLSAIRIFDKDLSSEEYNEWIVRNEYSKQIPLECQVAEMGNTEDEREFYDLTGHYKVSPNSELEIKPFHARSKLNHENWPLFQHFIRLLTDPFIYVQSMELTTRNEILYLLENAMNPNRSRLQCDHLWLNLEGNVPKFISWIKDHVRCDIFHIFGNNDSNKLIYDRALLDLFMTGENCSPEVDVLLTDSSPTIVYDFVQKFLDLKEGDEYQFAESIGFDVDKGYNVELKKKYSEFIVKEKPSNRGTTNYTFEFVNNNIGKKLELTEDGYDLSCRVSNL